MAARQLMDIEAARKILLARHEKEVAEQEVKAAMQPVVTRNGPYVKKTKAAEPKQSQATTHKAGPDIFGLSLPAAGSISAQEFILAIRDAGKRSFQALNLNQEPIVVRRVDQSKVRDDTILAIAAYVGYDPKGNFGAQELAALFFDDLDNRAVRQKDPAGNFIGGQVVPAAVAGHGE